MVYKSSEYIPMLRIVGGKVERTGILQIKTIFRTVKLQRLMNRLLSEYFYHLFQVVIHFIAFKRGKTHDARLHIAVFWYLVLCGICLPESGRAVAMPLSAAETKLLRRT